MAEELFDVISHANMPCFHFAGSYEQYIFVLDGDEFFREILKNAWRAENPPDSGGYLNRNTRVAVQVTLEGNELCFQQRSYKDKPMGSIYRVVVLAE